MTNRNFSCKIVQQDCPFRLLFSTTFNWSCDKFHVFLTESRFLTNSKVRGVEHLAQTTSSDLAFTIIWWITEKSNFTLEKWICFKAGKLSTSTQSILNEWKIFELVSPITFNIRKFDICFKKHVLLSSAPHETEKFSISEKIRNLEYLHVLAKENLLFLLRKDTIANTTSLGRSSNFLEEKNEY